MTWAMPAIGSSLLDLDSNKQSVQTAPTGIEKEARKSATFYTTNRSGIFPPIVGVPRAELLIVRSRSDKRVLRTVAEQGSLQTACM